MIIICHLLCDENYMPIKDTFNILQSTVPQKLFSCTCEQFIVRKYIVSSMGIDVHLDQQRIHFFVPMSWISVQQVLHCGYYNHEF